MAHIRMAHIRMAHILTRGGGGGPDWPAFFQAEIANHSARETYPDDPSRCAGETGETQSP